MLPPLQIVDDTTFSVNGKNIKVVSSRDPLQLPWKAMEIDLVIEGTGVFIDTKGASKHIEAGAKKVRSAAEPAAQPLTGLGLLFRQVFPRGCTSHSCLDAQPARG